MTPVPLSLVENNDAEVALLRRVALGDVSAFDTLYRVYFRRLQRFLGKLLSHPNVLDEVLDDTMVVVWQKADTFTQESKVSTWIFGIAYNKAQKAAQREHRWLARCAQAIDEGAQGSDPQRDIMASQIRQEILRVMATLPEEQRAVVELTYYHGCAYKDIAQILDCPEDTVKTRMFHARRKLRPLLMTLWPGAES